MRVLIAGGGPRIGTPLAEALAADDHQIYILNNSPQHRLARSHPAIESMSWDGRSAAPWVDLIDDNTAIFNLNEALIHPVNDRHNHADSYLHSSRVIADAIDRTATKPAALFHVVSISYYGDCEDDMVVEQTPCGDDSAARTCHTLEGALYGLPTRTCLLRMGTIFERREDVLAQAAPIPGLPHWLSWIHQQDMIRALRFLLDDGVAEGPFNIVAPQPITRQRLLTIVADTLDMGGPLENQPAFTDTLPPSQRVIPQRLMSLGFRFRFPEAEDALRYLLLCHAPAR